MKYYTLKILFCLLLVLMQAKAVRSQPDHPYLIKHQLISMEQGLSSREVFCAAQDAEGFMWFGTRNGLNRYDGTKFLLFNQDVGGLKHNRIVQLASDKAGQLFIVYGDGGSKQGSIGEIDVMDIRTQRTRSLSATFPKLPFKERDVFAVSNDGTSDIVFLTENPSCRWKYRPGKGFWLVEKYQDSLLNAKRYSWLAVFQNGACFRRLDGALVGGRLPSMEKEQRRQLVLGIDSTRGLTILVETNTNEWKIQTAGHDQIPKYPVNDLTYSFKDGVKLKYRPSVGESSCIIFGPKDGIVLYNNQELITLVQPGGIQDLENIFVSQSVVDSRGIRWLCTSIGILKFTLRDNRFTHYFTRAQQQQLANNQVRGIDVSESGKVVAAVWNQLMVQDKNGEVKSVLAQDIVYAVLRSTGNFFIGTNALLVYDDQRNTVKEVSRGQVIEIWALHRFSDSTLIVGCTKGTTMYDERSRKFTPVRSLLINIPEVSFGYRFYRDKKGKLWLVAENGLFGYNDAGNIDAYSGPANNWHSKRKWPEVSLQDAYEDTKGNLWMATNGGGLIRYDPVHDSLQQFRTKEGLPSDILYRIEPDEAYGYLWISSDNGLIRFHMETHDIQTYTSNDGLSHNEFNRISSFKSPDGRLLFGGLNGINAFNPRNFDADKKNTSIPIKVTSFLQYPGKNDSLEDRTTLLSETNRIIMDVGDRFFTMEFALLDFESHAPHYAYRIDGIDDGWNYINSNSLRISGLPYGQFTMHVKAQLSNGQWNTSELRIPITVKQPIYKAWWFILAMSLCLTVFIFLFIKLRTKRLITEKERLEKVVGERTEQLRETLHEREMLLREIHHRVKNNLQVISSLQQLQSSRTQDPAVKAQLEESQSRVLSIAFIHQNLYLNNNLKGVEMYSFVQELSNHIFNVFGRDELNVQLKLDMPEIALNLDTAVPLGLIINELITNSYKHAFKGRSVGIIAIHLKLQRPDVYLFTYQDDGPGLPAPINQENANSLGLLLIRQLSEQLDGTIIKSASTVKGYSFNLLFSLLEQQEAEG